MNSIPFKNQILFLIYFGLSTIITWWFIDCSSLYFNSEQKLLSTLVAGGKWGLQIILAFVLLGHKKWVFLKNIGMVCFIGSCILIPFIILSQFNINNNIHFFVGSLVSAVVAMIYYYYRAVRLSMVNISWWYFWMLCLVLAITLQLTIVFHIL